MILQFSVSLWFLSPRTEPQSLNLLPQAVPACAGTICHWGPDVLTLPVCKPVYFPLYSFSETDEPLFFFFLLENFSTKLNVKQISIVDNVSLLDKAGKV